MNRRLASTGVGIDELPRRPRLATAVLFVVVVVVAAGFAHVFRNSAKTVLDWYGDSRDPTIAARTVRGILVALVIVATVVIAALANRLAERRWTGQTGVDAVAASARGESRRISLRATGLRSSATWLVSAGMVSIGRESAIIEAGGALGTTVGRHSRGRGAAMAAAGIAAAFTAAYHAPIAAVLYVEEHLQVRRSRRGMSFVIGGAAGGYAASRWLFHGEVIFPHTQGPRWTMLALAAAIVVPAVLAARLFLQLRAWLSRNRIVRVFGIRAAVVTAVLAGLSGVMVALFPLSAGNGMEGLHHVAIGATLSAAVAISIGKAIATAATLGSGAPGGVISPTMSVVGGFALLSLFGLEHLGLHVDRPWDVVVAAMAVGIAVGLRAPLLAVVFIPELLGDYTLVPVIAVVVGVAWLLDRGLDRVVLRIVRRLPTGVYAEDA